MVRGGCGLAMRGCGHMEWNVTKFSLPSITGNPSPNLVRLPSITGRISTFLFNTPHSVTTGNFTKFFFTGSK